MKQTLSYRANALSAHGFGGCVLLPLMCLTICDIKLSFCSWYARDKFTMGSPTLTHIVTLYIFLHCDPKFAYRDKNLFHLRLNSESYKSFP